MPVEGRLGLALGRSRRRLRNGGQGPDRQRAALLENLPRAWRTAARRLQLRAFSGRTGPENLEVEGQRHFGGGVAGLCHAGKPELLHVPEAENGEAPLFRRDPEGRGRISRLSRSLSEGGSRTEAQ